MAVNVIRDERMIMVENASYKWSYIALLLGLALDFQYRILVKRGVLPDWHSLIDSSGDLLGLAFVSAALGAVYQWHHGILGHLKPRRIFLTMAMAVVAVLMLQLIDG